MNVAGLSNLGFQAPAVSPGRGSAKSAPSSSEKGEKSSFADVLGKREDHSQPTSRTYESSPQAQKRELDEKSSQNDSGERNAKSESYSQRDGGEVAGKPAPQESDRDVRTEDDAQTEDLGSGLPASQGLSGFQGPGLDGHNMAPQQVNPVMAANITKPLTAPTSDDKANSLTRRVVWNEFLRKMNKLGVSAEDVLKAFGSLTKEELAQPAEKSIDKLVMALGLDGQQALLAKKYFSELIQKTRSKSLGEELAASQKQVSLAVMTQKELNHKNLLRALDEMDQRFFVKPQMPKEAGQLAPELQKRLAPDRLEQARQAQAELAPLQQQNEENRLDVLAPPLAPPTSVTHPAGAGMAANTQVQSLNPNSPQIQQLAAQLQTLAPNDRKMIAEMIHSARRAQLDPRNALRGQQIGAAPTAEPNSAAMVRLPVPTPAPLAAGDVLSADPKNADSSSDDSGTDDGADYSALNALASMDHRTAQTQHTDFQSQLQQVAPQPGANQMSVPDLVQQAQIMTKDGGGVMKVTLHPDGLGEVAMRVSVENGKVAVQMITESDEAKKLIEHQLNDLKTGLQQNHLQVDSIKVDTASNMGRQLEQQYRDAQKQQTHLAWEQFRQDNQGWRRSFFEGGAVNPYSSQINAPTDVSSRPSASVRDRSLGSRRLDLVA